MNVYSSLDGKHWKLEWDGASQDDWTYNADLEVEENAKVVPLSGVSARYLKLEVVKSIRNYFASHELPVFKKDGSKPFAVGSTNKNETVSEGDYPKQIEFSSIETIWELVSKMVQILLIRFRNEAEM